MYAIVDVKDKQFKVRESDTLYVPYHSDAEVDDTLTLDRVLLLSDGEGEVTLGTPTVDNASVVARVVDQVQGDKVLVFKKKRRKRYRVKRGHRQQYTQIKITALHTDNGAAAANDASAEEEASDADTTTDASVASDDTVEIKNDAEDEDATAAEETTIETEADDVSTDAEEPSSEAPEDEAPEDEAAADDDGDVTDEDEDDADKTSAS